MHSTNTHIARFSRHHTMAVPGGVCLCFQGVSTTPYLLHQLLFTTPPVVGTPTVVNSRHTHPSPWWIEWRTGVKHHLAPNFVKKLINKRVHNRRLSERCVPATPSHPTPIFSCSYSFRVKLPKLWIRHCGTVFTLESSFCRMKCIEAHEFSLHEFVVLLNV